MKLCSFKTKKRTKRWNKNQRVWILADNGNHSLVVYRWRGKGRWVKGLVDNKHYNYKPDEFEIDDAFYERLYSKGGINEMHRL